MDERERDFLVVVGYIYLQHGDAQSAASLIELVHATYPSDSDAACLLAYAYLQQLRFRECLDVIEGIPSGTSPRLVQLLRSRALLGLGHQGEARTLWKHARQELR